MGEKRDTLSVFKGSWRYSNPYSYLYDKYSADVNFNGRLYSDFVANGGDPKTFFALVEANKGQELSVEFYKDELYDLNLKMKELTTTLEDDTNSIERFAPQFNEESGEWEETSIGNMSDKAYSKYQIDRAYQDMYLKLEVEAEKARKEALGGLKHAHNFAAILGEIGEGFLAGLAGAFDTLVLIGGLVGATIGFGFTSLEHDKGKSFASDMELFLEFSGEYASKWGALAQLDKTVRKDLNDYQMKYTTFRDLETGEVSTLGKFCVSISNSIGRMLPTYIANKYSGGAHSTVFQGLYYGGSFVGNLKENVDNPELGGPASVKYANALAKAGVEWAVEAALSKIRLTGKGRMMGYSKSLTKAIKPTRWSGVRSILADAIWEGVEEVVQEFSGMCIDNFTGVFVDGYKRPFDVGTLVDAFIMGAISSLLISEFQVLTGQVGDSIRGVEKPSYTYEVRRKRKDGSIEPKIKERNYNRYTRHQMKLMMSDFMNDVNNEIKKTGKLSKKSLEGLGMLSATSTVIGEYLSGIANGPDGQNRIDELKRFMVELKNTAEKQNVKSRTYNRILKKTFNANLSDVDINSMRSYLVENFVNQQQERNLYKFKEKIKNEKDFNPQAVMQKIKEEYKSYDTNELNRLQKMSDEQVVREYSEKSGELSKIIRGKALSVLAEQCNVINNYLLGNKAEKLSEKTKEDLKEIGKPIDTFVTQDKVYKAKSTEPTTNTNDTLAMECYDLRNKYVGATKDILDINKEIKTINQDNKNINDNIEKTKKELEPLESKKRKSKEVKQNIEDLKTKIDTYNSEIAKNKVRLDESRKKLETATNDKATIKKELDAKMIEFNKAHKGQTLSSYLGIHNGFDEVNVSKPLFDNLLKKYNNIVLTDGGDYAFNSDNVAVIPKAWVENRPATEIIDALEQSNLAREIGKTFKDKAFLKMMTKAYGDKTATNIQVYSTFLFNKDFFTRFVLDNVIDKGLSKELGDFVKTAVFTIKTSDLSQEIQTKFLDNMHSAMAEALIYTSLKERKTLDYIGANHILTQQEGAEVVRLKFINGDLNSNSVEFHQQAIRTFNECIEIIPKDAPYREDFINLYEKVKSDKFKSEYEVMDLILTMRTIGYLDAFETKSDTFYFLDNFTQLYDKYIKQNPTYIAYENLIRQQYGVELDVYLDNIVKLYTHNMDYRGEFAQKLCEAYDTKTSTTAVKNAIEDYKNILSKCTGRDFYVKIDEKNGLSVFEGSSAKKVFYINETVESIKNRLLARDFLTDFKTQQQVSDIVSKLKKEGYEVIENFDKKDLNQILQFKKFSEYLKPEYSNLANLKTFLDYDVVVIQSNNIENSFLDKDTKSIFIQIDNFEYTEDVLNLCFKNIISHSIQHEFAHALGYESKIMDLTTNNISNFFAQILLNEDGYNNLLKQISLSYPLFKEVLVDVAKNKKYEGYSKNVERILEYNMSSPEVLAEYTTAELEVIKDLGLDFIPIGVSTNVIGNLLTFLDLQAQYRVENIIMQSKSADNGVLANIEGINRMTDLFSNAVKAAIVTQNDIRNNNVFYSAHSKIENSRQVLYNILNKNLDPHILGHATIHDVVMNPETFLDPQIYAQLEAEFAGRKITDYDVVRFLNQNINQVSITFSNDGQYVFADRNCFNDFFKGVKETHLNKEGKYKLSDFFDKKVLDAFGYPDITVGVGREGSSAFTLNPLNQSGIIYISKADAKNDVLFELALIHEFRHMIQTLSGLAIGFTDNVKISNKYLKNMMDNLPKQLFDDVVLREKAQSLGFSNNRDINKWIAGQFIYYTVSGEIFGNGLKEDLLVSRPIIVRTISNNTYELIMPWSDLNGKNTVENGVYRFMIAKDGSLTHDGKIAPKPKNVLDEFRVDNVAKANEPKVRKPKSVVESETEPKVRKPKTETKTVEPRVVEPKTVVESKTEPKVRKPKTETKTVEPRVVEPKTVVESKTEPKVKKPKTEQTVEPKSVNDNYNRLKKFEGDYLKTNSVESYKNFVKIILDEKTYVDIKELMDVFKTKSFTSENARSVFSETLAEVQNKLSSSIKISTETAWLAFELFYDKKYNDNKYVKELFAKKTEQRVRKPKTVEPKVAEPKVAEPRVRKPKTEQTVEPKTETKTVESKTETKIVETAAKESEIFAKVVEKALKKYNEGTTDLKELRIFVEQEIKSMEKDVGIKVDAKRKNRQLKDLFDTIQGKSKTEKRVRKEIPKTVGPKKETQTASLTDTQKKNILTILNNAIKTAKSYRGMFKTEEQFRAIFDIEVDKDAEVMGVKISKTIRDKAWNQVVNSLIQKKSDTLVGNDPVKLGAHARTMSPHILHNYIKPSVLNNVNAKNLIGGKWLDAHKEVYVKTFNQNIYTNAKISDMTYDFFFDFGKWSDKLDDISKIKTDKKGQAYIEWFVEQLGDTDMDITEKYVAAHTCLENSLLQKKEGSLIDFLDSEDREKARALYSGVGMLGHTFRRFHKNQDVDTLRRTAGNIIASLDKKFGKDNKINFDKLDAKYLELLDNSLSNNLHESKVQIFGGNEEYQIRASLEGFAHKNADVFEFMQFQDMENVLGNIEFTEQGIFGTLHPDNMVNIKGTNFMILAGIHSLIEKSNIWNMDKRTQREYLGRISRLIAQNVSSSAKVMAIQKKMVRDFNLAQTISMKRFALDFNIDPHGPEMVRLKEAIERLNKATTAQDRKTAMNDINNASEDIYELMKKNKTEMTKEMKENLKKKDKKNPFYRQAVKDRRYRRLEKMHSFRFASMLSGPFTAIRNIQSNVILTPMNKASDRIGKLIFPKKGYRDGQINLNNIKVSQEVKNFINEDFLKSPIVKSMFEGKNKYSMPKGDVGDVDANLVMTDLIQKALENRYRTHNRFDSKTGNFLSKIVDAMISDKKFIEHAVKNYFGKHLQHMVDKGEIDIDNVRMDVKVVDAFSNALIMGAQDYMHKGSWLGKAIEGLADTHPAAYNVVKFFFPFVNSSFNWFLETLKYTPLGLAASIVRMAKLEQQIALAELRLSKGMSIPHSAFTEFLIRRDIGKGVIGTILTLVGVGLAVAGILSIDEEDKKFYMRIGDVKVDISNIFGTSSVLMGAALAGSGGDFDAIMVNALDPMFEGFILTDIIAKHRWGNSVWDSVLMETESVMRSFVPQMAQMVVRMTNDEKIKYTPGMTGMFERWLNSFLVTQPMGDRKINIYTGENETKYALPVIGEIMRAGILGPKMFWHEVTEEELLATEYGVNKSQLTGEITANGQKYKIDTVQLNKKYAEINKKTILALRNSKHYVQMPNGKYKVIHWNNLTDNQRANVINREMSKNATYAKVYVWTKGGHKYYATPKMRADMRKYGISKNVLSGNKGFEE